MKIKRSQITSSIETPFWSNNETFEKAKRTFILDVISGREKEMIASIVLCGGKTSKISIFHHDYDAGRIAVGASILSALAHQVESGLLFKNIPIRMQKVYRFLKKEFDFKQIMNEIGNQEGTIFLAINVYVHHIKLFSNASSHIALELAGKCKELLQGGDE